MGGTEKDVAPRLLVLALCFKMPWSPTVGRNIILTPRLYHVEEGPKHREDCFRQSNNDQDRFHADGLSLSRRLEGLTA